MQPLRLTYTVPRRGLQSNGVQRSSARSAFNPGCEGRAGAGSAWAIPSRVVVGEEEASEQYSPPEQLDHQCHVAGSWNQLETAPNLVFRRCSTSVATCLAIIIEQPQDGSLSKRTLLCAPAQLVSKTSKGPPEPEKNSEDSHTQQCSTDGFFTPSMRAASFLASCPWHKAVLYKKG